MGLPDVQDVQCIPTVYLQYEFYDSIDSIAMETQWFDSHLTASDSKDPVVHHRFAPESQLAGHSLTSQVSTSLHLSGKPQNTILNTNCWYTTLQRINTS